MPIANQMTIAQWRAHEAAQAKKESKYKNVRVTIPGHAPFDSQRECDRFFRLRADPRVKALKRQVFFKLHAPNGSKVCGYFADFTYWEENPKTGLFHFIVEDSKGVRTAVYRLKFKMMQAEYGIKILET